MTWGSGAAGVSGAVSAVNGLAGSTANDQVGIVIALLYNGSYVVSSPNWDNGAKVDAGAVTLGIGAGCAAGSSAAVGPITGANSIVALPPTAARP